MLGRLNTSNRLNGSRLGNLSLNNGSSGGNNKRLSESLLRKTPSKTPKKSPGRENTSGTTPTRKTPGAADRFIPNRTATDFETSRYRYRQ